MDRRSLIKSAAAELPRRATLAVYPDHPFLLEPPDILAAAGGLLYAVFVVSGRERFGRGRHTIARHLLARLALPADTLFLAFVEDPADLRAIPAAAFDDVRLVGRSRRPALASEPAGGPWRATTDELRTLHLQRFSEAWGESTPQRARAVRRRTEGPTTARLSSESRGLPPRALGQSLAFAADHLVLDAPVGASRPQSVRLVQRAARTAAEADYGLGNSHDAWGDLAADHEPHDQAEPTSTLGHRSVQGNRRTSEDRAGGHEPLPVAQLSRYAGLLTTGQASLAMHRAFLPLRDSPRTFDIAKPRRAAAFAGYLTQPLAQEQT